MKRLFYFFLFVCVAVIANAQAKYVFYFIGDGMGVNQVNGTEMYRAEIQKGRIGVEPLLFTQFPVGTMATTFSATNSVTDSSAAVKGWELPPVSVSIMLLLLLSTHISRIGICIMK